MRLGSRLGLGAICLESLGSFKVSASVSEAVTSRLGLGLGSEDLVHIPELVVVSAKVRRASASSGKASFAL